MRRDPRGWRRGELEAFVREFCKPGHGPADGTVNMGYGGEPEVVESDGQYVIRDEGYVDFLEYVLEANTPGAFRRAMILSEFYYQHHNVGAGEDPEYWL